MVELKKEKTSAKMAESGVKIYGRKDFRTQI